DGSRERRAGAVDGAAELLGVLVAASAARRSLVAAPARRDAEGDDARRAEGEDLALVHVWFSLKERCEPRLAPLTAQLVTELSPGCEKRVKARETGGSRSRNACG